MAEKQNFISYQIVLTLLEGDYIAVSTLAKQLAISEKSVRTKLENIDDVLAKAKHGYIEKIPRKGVRLCCAAAEKNEIRKLFSNFEGRSEIAAEEPLYEYLKIIFTNDANRLTVNRLHELTFDSIPLCNKNLASCRQWLTLFDITLSVKRNYGIIIKATEENWRRAIKHLIFSSTTHSIEGSLEIFAKGLNLKLLKQCIHETESEWNFQLADESYNEILVDAALVIIRSVRNPIHLTAEEESSIVEYSEYNLSQSIFKKVNECFRTTISENEIKYFTIQILCSHMLSSQSIQFTSRLKDYDEQLNQFVTKIISVISDITNVDLNHDQELFSGLLNHIRPAIFRMKFNRNSANSDIISYIQEQYKQTYRVSWALSALFESYYDIRISSCELSYIALYIQSSLDRMIQPLKMAFVTGLGMGMNQLFCNEVKLTVPKVESIDIFSLHDFNHSHLQKYDVIVTTTKLEDRDDKIINIGAMLDGHCMDELAQNIKVLREKQCKACCKLDVSCHHLFEPKLILIKPEVSTKADVIALMANELLNCGYVTEGYYNAIMDRERTVSTCIGNGVAIPHGNQAFVNQSKVVIATLKEPIEWCDSEKVRIVFMLALRINNAYESRITQLFYKGFLDLIATDKDVDKMIGMENEQLYQYLIR